MSRPQDPRTAKLSRSRLMNAPRRRPTRDLQIECLESRVVLSGLPNVEVATPDLAADQATATSVVAELANSVYSTDSETTDVVLARSEVNTTGAITEAPTVTSPTNSTLTVVNLVPDVLAGHNTGPTAPTVSAGPPRGSGLPLLPPIIENFSASCQGEYWRFSGRVLDDKDVAGLTIRFGGLLNGCTATVDEDGFFEYIAVLGFNPVGSVSAYTIDLDGLRSETVSLLVG